MMTGQAMKGRAGAVARRNRWAISFADLCLLLLGFFVLLQANSRNQKEIIEGVAQQFGAPVRQGESLLAAELFQPGEALLTPQGEARLKAVAARHGDRAFRLEIRSIGLDRSANRFDTWDLAAARLGAVARSLTQAGIGRDRLIIRGLDDEGGATVKGQQIILSPRPIGKTDE